jgi:HEAT repeat protein
LGWALGLLAPAAVSAAPPRLTELLSRLEHGDSRERQFAARQLRNYSERAVPGLCGALKDPDAGVRAVAASSLAAVFAPPHRRPPPAARALPLLIKLLRDRSTAVCCGAAEALQALGPVAVEAIPELIRLLKRPDTPDRRPGPPVLLLPGCKLGQRVASTLGAMGPRALPALLPLLGHTRAEVRALAADALGGLGASAGPAASALGAALGDKDEGVRLAAARALGAAGQAAAAAVPALTRALEDRSDLVRGAAVRALEALGPRARAAGPRLARLLRSDPNALVRTAAGEALLKVEPALGRNMLRDLIRCLGKRDDDLRRSCARALGTFGAGARSAVPRLLRLLRVKRGAAPPSEVVVALGRIGDRRASRTLIRLLTHRDDGTRHRAAEALGRLKDPRAINPLYDALGKEREPHIKRAVAEVLASFGARSRGRAREALARAFRSRRPADAVVAATIIAGTGLDSGLLAMIGRVASDPGRQTLAHSVCSLLPADQLITATRRGDATAQVGAAHCVKVKQIGKHGAAVRAALIQLLSRGTVAGRRAAARALLFSADEQQAVRALVVALRDGDAGVRQAAAETLEAAVKHAALVLPALRRLREDPSPAVRRAAARSLARIEASRARSKR